MPMEPGGVAAVLFATLMAGLALTVQNFDLVDQLIPLTDRAAR